MVIGIHQPNFLPWLGFFYKLLSSDFFVFLDIVQFTKNSFINRTRVRAGQNELWLTIPVRTGGRFKQAICEVEISNTNDWRKKHLGTLQGCYGRAPFFRETFEQIKGIYYQRDWTNLCEFNIALIEWIMRELKIEKKAVRASVLQVSGKSTELLINLVKKLDGTVYLSGHGGRKYQDEEMFRAQSVQLEYYNFKHPVYTQLHGSFIPNLSILDLLFSYGPDTKKIIVSNK